MSEMEDQQILKIEGYLPYLIKMIINPQLQFGTFECNRNSLRAHIDAKPKIGLRRFGIMTSVSFCCPV